MENFWASTHLRSGMEYSRLTEFKWHGNETTRSGYTKNPNYFPFFFQEDVIGKENFWKLQSSCECTQFHGTWSCRRFDCKLQSINRWSPVKIHRAYTERNRGNWHSEDRASWYILITKDNETHYFSVLFGTELYMFRTDLMSIIRSLNTVFSAKRCLSY
jgi:hypothetical protein